MSLSKEEFDRYHESIAKLKEHAMGDLEKALRKVWRNEGKSRKDALDVIVRTYAPEIANLYGLSAASVSAALWEDIYHNDTGSRLEALIPEHDDYDKYFGDAAVAVVEEKSDENDLEGAISFLGAITAKAVHDWARRTQTSNTTRVVRGHYKGADSARWARVPTGDRTCAWCLMLASRGFEYVSEWTAKYRYDGFKYHDCCDCEAISSFDDNPLLESYDPAEYRHMYESARVYDSAGRVDLSGTLSNMRSHYGLK